MPVGLPGGWELDLLRDLSAPTTADNIAFLDAWQQREGGSTNNTCDWNPFNTMQTEPGSHNCTPLGIQAYGSWPAGEEATATTIRRYPAILAMLRTGKPDPNYPGVAGEIYTWSGHSYTWPGSGSAKDSGACGKCCVYCPSIPIVGKHCAITNPICRLQNTEPANPIESAGKGAITGTIGVIKDLPSALHFLFSYRFLEILGGGILVVVGLWIMGRQVAT